MALLLNASDSVNRSYTITKPSPTHPLDVVGVGELETTGEHAGQYKIPISSADTTTPVYLGEVQSTRRIKKLVLTGEETWGRNTTAVSGISLFNMGIDNAMTQIAPISTHYIGSAAITWRDVPTNGITVSIVSSNLQRLVINMGTTYSEVADFKAYLATQYANGTPVTVWYVLSSPTTAITNEPLMKIGTYADTLATSIPCTAGENTLDVQTTVQPSEVTISYKGWHPVQNAHERDNGAWT
jgi:hypothetical protein